MKYYMRILKEEKARSDFDCKRGPDAGSNPKDVSFPVLAPV